MGGGSYSSLTRSARAKTAGYYTKSTQEIFAKQVNSSMNPHGLRIRESRDSDEHPESLAIILGLDVTGSMQSVPHHLVKDGLPNLVQSMIDKGIEHPQIMFTAIGDHTCDSAPLQVGQFESSDELLDKWLTDTWLEGRGGGNDGESYMLAWYLASKHTSIDCYEKRKHKGFLFTIGDEKVLPSIDDKSLKAIMGDGQYDSYETKDLLEHAKEKYHVYHVHVAETGQGSEMSNQRQWRELLGDNLIIVQRHEQIPSIIADKIVEIHQQQVGDIDLNLHEVS